MPDLLLEQQHAPTFGSICGIDEAGRGPLAGPVVAAAVILPNIAEAGGGLPLDVANQIDDSKKLTSARRAFLAEKINGLAHVGIGIASVEEIDQINILQATFLAMSRALDNLPLRPGLALVDGNQTPSLPCSVKTVISGDQLSLSIAAASIVAKVYRDNLMADLARDHPQYGWETNCGYGTPQHCQALRQFGPTPHHRRSFAPLIQFELTLAESLD